MKGKRIIGFLTVALLFAGCFKDVSHKTTYILKPLMQKTSGETPQPVGAVAYAYNVDTLLWTVAGYDDARQGVVSLKENPAEKMSSPAATAESYELEGTVGWLQMSLSKSTQMVVLVDTVDRIYAYTQQELVDNLPQLYVSVLFKLWKEGNSYADGKWSFYNEFYAPPVYLECSVEPTAQYEDGGATAAVVKADAYAYAVDTTRWCILSYQDALDGIISLKSDTTQKRSTPSFKAYQETDTNLYKMQVSESELMLVVVDQTDKMYAYTRQEVDLTGSPVSFPVLFRPWLKTWITTDNGWCYVDESSKPATQTSQSVRRQR